MIEVAMALRLADRPDADERAVLLVMYDLALRACEVQRLARASFDEAARTVELLEPAKDGEVEPIGIAVRTANAIRAAGGVGVFLRWPEWRVKRLVRRAATEAGLPPRCRYSHILRRSRATHMIEAGATIKDVQRRLRHKSEQTTWLYVGVTPARAREVDAIASAMIDH